MPPTVWALVWGLRLALRDLSTSYTWYSWTIGWLVRVVAQVAVFALIGEMLGSRERTEYLLVGNAAAIASMTALRVVPAVTRETRAGTLGYLVASREAPERQIAARGLMWVVDAVASSVVALLVTGLAFRVIPGIEAAPMVLALLVLIAVSTYAFGLALGSLVLWNPVWRNLASNMAYIGLIAVAGVAVPTSFYPWWIDSAASLLPLSNGLEGIRGLYRGIPGEAIAAAGREVLVAVGWILVAMALFRLQIAAARRRGTIDFGS